MIIKSFIAKNVHGYLDFNIQFKEDINFLVGHNGSGKTTALKMMTALLSPDLKELAKLPFDSCIVEFIDPKTTKHSSIQVSKTDFDLTLTTSLSSEAVEYKLDELISDDYIPDNLIREISKLANPIIISLDRKFTDRQLYKNNASSWIERVRYKNLLDHNSHEDTDSPLFGVRQLIETEIARIGRKKANEDAKLKDRILLDAFKVIDCSNELLFSVSSSYDNKELNEKRNLIITTLESLSLKNKNLQDVKHATDTFFYELTKNVDEVRKYENLDDNEKFTNRKYMDAMSFLFSNRAQLIRIDNMVEFIRSSHNVKSRSYEKVYLFEKIVNSFFEQTGKVISIKTGQLKINVNGRDIEVDSLSSGETQIITLFAHIIFNRRLLSKASFMIDEPELSLHLAWQEMFVESLKQANADLQIILATHSPAIIKGMDDKCVFVNSSNMV